MKNKWLFILLLIFTSCGGQLSNPLIIPGYKQIVALESYHTDKYTYVMGFGDGLKVWLACPISEITNGETYYFKDELMMTQFQSKETGKIFDKILFVQELSTDPITSKKLEGFHHPTIEAEPQSEALPTSEGTGLQKAIALETMNAAKYTYMRAQTSTGEKWFAFPKSVVIIGKEYSYTDAMLMIAFESHDLNRKFDSIYFLSGIHEVNEEVVQPVEKSVIKQKPEIHTQVIALADLLTHAKSYSGKMVTISGKVTKYNPEIMGRNWIHITDESGQSVTVTSDQAVTVGNIYLCSGSVVLNKDFGAGYKYDLLIEQAQISLK